MRVRDLTLHNVGPFDDARIEFLTGDEGEVPVTFITGENGTGKTVVLDAIRGAFGEQFAYLDRSICRPDVPFSIQLDLEFEGARHSVQVTHQYSLPQRVGKFGLYPKNNPVIELPQRIHQKPGICPPWIVDFWRSALPNDGYVIRNFAQLNPVQLMTGALQGIQRNTVITELICYFDYLRSSEDPKERADGDLLYSTIKEIFRVSLLEGGEFSHVARSTFTPMVKQSGQLVPLANLSSGNAYLAQHLINMLGKMYAVHVLRGTPSEDLCKTPGLLLIDEAENHLHPRWQQRFIRDVLSIFPNLQIIATTHSPFIVASAPGAKVFVCRYDSDRKCCVIDDESRAYENKPIEEILLSPAFGETQPFGPDMANLLDEWKQAIETGDDLRAKQCAAELKQRNPDYFSYMDAKARLEEVLRLDKQQRKAS